MFPIKRELEAMGSPKKKGGKLKAAGGMAFTAFAGLLVGLSANELPRNHLSEEALPKPQFHLPKEHFSVQYDGRLKQPAYVYETLLAEQLTGNADREGLSFKEDGSLPHQVRSTHSDYSGSGYDRGHLSPASNHKNCDNAMQESFLYSNICPQKAQFNRGYWKKVEKRAQELAKEYGKVIAITGPLFLSEKGKDGKRYVSYEVIGENEVAAPTHFFKVIKTPAFTKAYLLKNEKIDASIDLETFSVPLEKIERAAGIVF